MGLLDGKVAFITGGSRGQGRAHAVRSAQEGADIVILDAPKGVETTTYALGTEEDLAETVRQVEALDRRILSVAGDVRSSSDLDAAVARGVAEFGKIDILIANAGIWSQNPVWELTDDQWQDMIDINLTGVWRSAKAVIPHMISNGSGSIVITSSVNGLEPGPLFAHYTAAKHGVVGLMKTIALELAPHGVRCNAVHPGAVNTPMTDNPMAWDMYAGHPGGTKDDLISAGYHYGVLRGTTFMDPVTIANAGVFLNSELASNVTGISLPVDSGHLLIPGVNTSPIKD